MPPIPEPDHRWTAETSRGPPRTGETHVKAGSDLGVGGRPRLKNALSGGNLGLTEALIWRISAYTD